QCTDLDGYSLPTRRSSDLVRDRGARGPHRRVEVGLEDALDLLGRRVLQSVPVLLVRRVEDEDVEPAEFGDHVLDEFSALLLVPRSEEHTSELQSREKLVCR